MTDRPNLRRSEFLPWGCVAKFDRVGLPVYEATIHRPATCECAARRAETLISQLQVWEGVDAAILKLDDWDISRVILMMIDKWGISEADPDWTAWLREHRAA